VYRGVYQQPRMYELQFFLRNSRSVLVVSRAKLRQLLSTTHDCVLLRVSYHRLAKPHPDTRDPSFDAPCQQGRTPQQIRHLLANFEACLSVTVLAACHVSVMSR
jgi:hypothetical protein